MCGLTDCPLIHKRDCGYDNPENKRTCPGYPVSLLTAEPFPIEENKEVKRDEILVRA